MDVHFHSHCSLSGIHAGHLGVPAGVLYIRAHSICSRCIKG